MRRWQKRCQCVFTALFACTNDGRNRCVVGHSLQSAGAAKDTPLQKGFTEEVFLGSIGTQEAAQVLKKYRGASSQKHCRCETCGFLFA